MPAQTVAVGLRRRYAGVGGELLRFAVVGAFSYGLGIGLSAALHEAVGLAEETAVAIALAVVLCTNFFLARGFIFRSAGRLHRQMAHFAVTAVAMRFVEYLLFLGALTAFGLNYLVALTAAMAVSNGLKFVLYRAVVFRPAADASEQR
jgi:putative flippase GtrA